MEGEEPLPSALRKGRVRMGAVRDVRNAHTHRQGSAAWNAFHSPSVPPKFPAAPQPEIRCGGCASPSSTQQREAPALPEPARSHRGCLSSATSISGTSGFLVFLRELGRARGTEPAGRDAPRLRVLWPGWKSHELPWSEGKNGLAPAWLQERTWVHLFSPPMHCVNADLSYLASFISFLLSCSQKIKF